MFKLSKLVPKVIMKMSRRQKLFMLLVLGVTFIVMLQNSPLTNRL